MVNWSKYTVETKRSLRWKKAKVLTTYALMLFCCNTDLIPILASIPSARTFDGPRVDSIQSLHTHYSITFVPATIELCLIVLWL